MASASNFFSLALSFSSAFTLRVSTRPCRDTSLCIVDASIEMPRLRQKLTDEKRNAALASFANQIGIDQAPAVIAEKKTMSAWKGLQIFFATLLLLIVGVLGFWLGYLTTSPIQFQSPAMDINDMIPAPLNRWGCDQLKRRFGEDRAPFKCTAADHMSWK